MYFCLLIIGLTVLYINLTLLFLSLTGAEGAEVLRRLGDDVVAELFIFDLCIERKERAGQREEKKEGGGRRSRRQDRWPFDRHRRKKRISFFSLSLSPAATTHRHLDAAQRGAIGGDVKEDDGVGHFDGSSVVEEEEEEGRRRWFWRRE